MINLKKIIISLFICVNFMSMFRVHLPQNTKLFKLIYSPIDTYLSYFSIYQDWYMFAPDPARMNVYLTAEVEFEDGSKDRFNFPRQTQLTLGEKYHYGEKYRKIISEGIRKEENRWMWKDTAKFVLRKVQAKNVARLPIRVHLIRNWDIIPEVKSDFRPHLSLVTTYKKAKFYTYELYQ